MGGRPGGRRALLAALKAAHPEIPPDELYARIMCGEVMVNGERVRDPARPVSRLAELAFAGRRFASRGGEKLEHAMQAWKIEVAGLVMLDAGASTGGFTDCLLRRGAAAVHAVDVGFGQLHSSLASDARVIRRDRTNIMELDALVPRPDAAVCDLSFRSLRVAAGHLLELCSAGWMVALVKPQFELIDPGPDFDGVIRSPARLRSVLEDLTVELAKENAGTLAVLESPIRGRQGNREFFFYLRRGAACDPTSLAGALDKIFNPSGRS